MVDQKIRISFMNKDWDKVDWKTGSGMSRTGIGQRSLPWPSHGGTGVFGGTNPTCGTCGGRLRGATKCSCDEPEWMIDGEPVDEGLEPVSLEHVHAQQAWHLIWLKEAYRVLRPGGVVKAFGATRTFHRLVAAMEEAGFKELKIEAWVYGSGFPKSLNISKALRRKAERDAFPEGLEELARKWEGWGTALKPAWESVVVGRKPK